MDLEGLVDEATLARMQRAASGSDERRFLRIGAARVGDVGVLRAQVASIAPPRTFRRKNGTEGLIGRVTFEDGTGEMEAPLWDDMNRLIRDGTFAVGQTVEIAGAVVAAGWRGGLELNLDAAMFTPVAAAGPTTLTGTIEAIADTQIVEGRFQADITLATGEGSIQVVVWDERVKQLRAKGVGATVTLADVEPHPLLDGRFLGDGARLA